MNENYEGEELDNIVILNDEDGNEVKFEFLDLVELDDEEYVVLLLLRRLLLLLQVLVIIQHIVHLLILLNLKIRILPRFRLHHLKL